jgi:hypothetical protein
MYGEIPQLHDVGSCPSLVIHANESFPHGEPCRFSLYGCRSLLSRVNPFDRELQRFAAAHGTHTVEVERTFSASMQGGKQAYRFFLGEVGKSWTKETTSVIFFLTWFSVTLVFYLMKVLPLHKLWSVVRQCLFEVKSK